MGERKISLEDGYPTSRGISEYAQMFGIDRRGFIGRIMSKNTILDLGAGGGVLEKELLILNAGNALHKIPLIFSLDIIYKSNVGIQYSKYATHLSFSNLGIKPNKIEFQNIENHFKKNSVAASYTNIPFLNNSFDMVFACVSLGLHSKSIQKLFDAYFDVIRVLKSGGEALISVGYDPALKKLYTGKYPNRKYYKLNDLPFKAVLFNNVVTAKDGNEIPNYWLSIIK